MEDKAPAKTVGRRILSILGIILCVILIPLLVINLTIIVKSFVYPNEVPSFLGYKPFIVLSNSMLPTIQIGDLVLDKTVDADTLQVGDIVSYREGTTTVITHRITAINDSGGVRQFTTKGDNNNTADANPVLESDVEGKMITSYHNIGNAALFMQTKQGMLIFIVLPLVVLGCFELFRRKSVNKTKKQETAELEKELERMRNLISASENSAKPEVAEEKDESEQNKEQISENGEEKPENGEEKADIESKDEP
jgi:signal peptidase I, archaeal type